jgi:hypothetical protein
MRGLSKDKETEILVFILNRQWSRKLMTKYVSQPVFIIQSFLMMKTTYV